MKKEEDLQLFGNVFFSIAQKYFHIFGVARLKEMEMKPVADWVRKNWEDGQGRIDKSFESYYAQK